MGARVLDVIGDRAQHVARGHACDPAAVRGLARRTDGTVEFAMPAADQAETISPGLFTTASSPELPLGDQVNRIRRMQIAD